MPEETRKKEEDKHFWDRDRELIEKLRAKAEAERREQEKKHRKETHWMKCPKCGHDMQETSHGPLMVDRCTECGGIYLDAGELELLMTAEKDTGLLRRLFGR